MLGKFFLSFVCIVGYFLIPAAILIPLEGILPDSFIIGAILVLVVGFLPFMWLVSKKVFIFPAKTTEAISKEELIEKISNLDIKNCRFSVEFHKDFMVLTPPYLNTKFVSLYSVEKYKTTYYMKLWFNPKTKTVRFKDHLISSNSIIGINNFTFNISAQSGYVSSSIHLLDSHGKLIHFSNNELHKNLIKVVTENGWNLTLKMF